MNSCVRLVACCSFVFSVAFTFAQMNIFAELVGNPVVTTGWSITHDAIIQNDEVVLTPAQNHKTGTIFFLTPIDFSSGGKFVVDFEFRMYGGNAADGIALNVLTQLPNPNGSYWGGGIGVDPNATGLKVVFDTYNNDSYNNTPNPEIQVVNGTGYSEENIPLSNRITNQTYLRSPSYQPARIVYDNGTLSIYVNCELKLTVPNVIIQNSGYFGFSAATGGQTDRHSIKNVKIYTTTIASGAKYVCSKTSAPVGVPTQTNNSYLWQAVDLSDNIDLLNDTTVSNPIFSMENNGDTIAVQRYLLTTTINSSGSCPIIITDTVEVNVYPAPTIENVSTELLCVSNTVSATATVQGGEQPLSYLWTISGDQSTISTTEQATGLVAGTYTFSVQDAHQCTDSQEVVVVITDKISLSLTASDIVLCRGDSTWVSVTHTGGVHPIVLSWLQKTADIDSNNPSFWASPQYDSLYTMIAVDSNGCTDTASIVIRVVEIPDANFQATHLAGCPPFTTQLNNLSTGNYATCLWKISDGRQFSSCTLDNQLLTFVQMDCYDVTLTVSTLEGYADTLTYTDYLCVYPTPSAAFHASPHELTPEERNVYLDNVSNGAESYLWDFGDGSPTDNQVSPTHDYPNDREGVYTITLVAISDMGCTDTATQIVQLKDVQQLYVPNAFSPNNDAMNEVFMPIITSGKPLTHYQLSIFDRWGEIVFETNDLNHSWDGNYKGSKMPDGLYTWKIFVESGKLVDRKNYVGHVYLMR